MKHVLLLGAGFSCNWGGWNASEVNDYLPTLPALRADRHVVQVLRRTANKGGFEAALAEIQDDYERSPTPDNKVHLDTLQSAITTMITALEAGSRIGIGISATRSSKRSLISSAGSTGYSP